MNKNTVGLALCAILAGSAAPAIASPINVTNSSLVTLQNNDSVLFYISSGISDPGEIELELGGIPVGGPVASIPGTSGVYISGILFTGTLESQNGLVSIPLTDPNAARLGLPAGDLLLTPGSVSGGSYSGPIDLLSAEVVLTSQEYAALFASGEAVIDLHDASKSITFGYSGELIGNDFSASMISSGGTESVGARVMQVDCNQVTAPEPGTIGLLVIGLAILATRLARRPLAPLPVHSN
jgi:hypothetical protein